MRKNGVLAQTPVVLRPCPSWTTGAVLYRRWGRVTIAPLASPCERDCAALLIWAMVFGLDGVAHVCGSCFFASGTGLAISSCLTS